MSFHLFSFTLSKDAKIASISLRYSNYCIEVMIHENKIKFQHETHIDILEILHESLHKNLFINFAIQFLNYAIPLRIQKKLISL